MGAAAGIDELRDDILVLRGMIDVALDRHVRADDPFLHACAATLRHRREQLEELQAEHTRTL